MKDNLKIYDECPECAGSGKRKKYTSLIEDIYLDCPTCNGTGKVQEATDADEY